MIIDISPITTCLPFGKSQLFSYSVPEEMQGQIQPGSIVEMPLGTRVVKGVVFGAFPSSHEGERKASPPHLKGLKPIKKIIQGVQLNQYQLNLAMWMHRFYHAPLGIVLKFFVPEIPKSITNYELRITNKNQKSKIKNTYKKSKTLNFSISQFLGNQNNRFQKYVELIKKYRKQNKQTLILVPQIIDVETLYLRLVETLQCNVSTLKNNITIGKIHSQLNMTEYYNNWAGFQSGEINAMIGTRQVVLSPPSNLGLIIIDEYQDDDFKQLDQTPRFSAVEAAKKVCEMTDAKLMLGASSPPLEGLPVHSNAEAGGARGGSSIYYFGKNVCSHPPLIPPSGMGGEIIDSQNEYFGKNFSPLSNKLQELLIDAAKNKKWAFILINRRGDASFIICRDCGNVIKCPKCEAPLVLHKNNQCKLLCHHCGYKMAPPEKCPKCSSPKIKYSSPGTQGVEREITNLIAAARPHQDVKRFGQEIASEKNIVRVDSDAIKTKKGMGDVLKKLRKESGIIIGTQAAAKIWMPAELDLIGAISIDSFLNRSDFRAAEKTFQIISELKSRLSENGKMIIQTFNPESKILSFAASGNFESFSKEELKVRKQFNYPPFCRIIKMTLLGRDIRKVLQEVDRMKKFIITNFKNIEIFGPIPSEIIKRGLFGKTLVLKVSGWNEKMHLELMKNIGDEWSVAPYS